ELSRRLSTFSGPLGRMGQRLAAAVEAYNAAVGSLERQVLPQARRFTDLGVTADAPLPALDPIVELARAPAAGCAPGTQLDVLAELAATPLDSAADAIDDLPAARKPAARG